MNGDGGTEEVNLEAAICLESIIGEGGEEGYFGLEEQMGSLLRREAFPALLHVRDMSFESDVIRRTGRVNHTNMQPRPVQNVLHLGGGGRFYHVLALAQYFAVLSRSSKKV